MTRQIEIPEPLFARLQKLATPLVDTPATIIERLLDHYETGRSGPTDPPRPQPSSGRRDFDPNSPPDLRHTRLAAARIGDQRVSAWNELARAAHAFAWLSGRFGSLDGLRGLTGGNLVEGECKDKGFTFIPEAGISLQGLDANDSWRQAFKVAKHFGTEICAEFVWHANPRAQHPGEQGRLLWRPQ